MTTEQYLQKRKDDLGKREWALNMSAAWLESDLKDFQEASDDHAFRERPDLIQVWAEAIQKASAHIGTERLSIEADRKQLEVETKDLATVN